MAFRCLTFEMCCEGAKMNLDIAIFGILTSICAKIVEHAFNSITQVILKNIIEVIMLNHLQGILSKNRVVLSNKILNRGFVLKDGLYLIVFVTVDISF